MAFSPQDFLDKILASFSSAKNVYGSLISEITGYSEEFLERNIKLPEFGAELKKRVFERFRKLKAEKLIDEEGTVSEKGIELAAVAMYVEELNRLAAAGLGEKPSKKQDVYGEKHDVKKFSGERYRDIAIRQSIKKAVRRGHRNIDSRDLMSFERRLKGKCSIIYALDASGSMRGEKIAQCKKAGVALAYTAIEEKDIVGLIVFSGDIRARVPPTDDLGLLIKEIAMIRAAKETDIAATLHAAIEMFPKQNITKHLVLITDAMPTVGASPEEETLKAASMARSNSIIISVVGIGLDEHGIALAEKIVEIGNGRLYMAQKLEDIDKIVLLDYYSLY